MTTPATTPTTPRKVQYLRPFTIEGCFIAQRGAEKMKANGGYRFERDQKFARKATIITPEGKRYGCHIGEFWYCGCPVCVELGICKHQVWLSEQLDEEDAMLRRLDEQAEGEREWEDMIAEHHERGKF